MVSGMSREANPQRCVDFVNTVNWRNDPARHEEKLRSIGDLIRWGHDHHLLSDAASRKVTHLAQDHPKIARQVFDRALVLRDAIYRVLSAVAAQREAAREDLQVISRESREVAKHMALKQSDTSFEWSWAGDDDALERVLWPVVQATTDLLTSNLLTRIRECEGPGCGWIILDQTKNRSRRWCEMKTCGNRAKVKRFYERHKEETRAQ